MSVLKIFQYPAEWNGAIVCAPETFIKTDGKPFLKYLIAPYAHFAITDDLTDLFVKDLSRKLSTVDPNNGLGVLTAYIDRKVDDHNLFQQLLALGVDPNLKMFSFDKVGQNDGSQASDGCTPLHRAVWKENLDSFCALLDAGADLTQKNSFGETVKGYMRRVNFTNKKVRQAMQVSFLKRCRR